MPSDGSGHGDNAMEDDKAMGTNIAHGTEGSDPSSDKVARADKTAPMPELEKGAALEGHGGSGGGSSNPTNPTGQGKGAQDSNKPAVVDQVTK